MSRRTFGIACGFAASLVVCGVVRAESRALALDGAHSFALFKIRHMGVGYVWGRFNQVKGEVVLDPASPEASTVSVSVPVETIDTGIAQRDNHLKSPDFFDAAQFTTIEFKSTAVKKTGDNTYDVTGDFTLHGVTKSLTVPATLLAYGPDPFDKTKTKQRGAFESTFTIKRSDFGMTKMIGPAADEVAITVNVEASK